MPDFCYFRCSDFQSVFHNLWRVIQFVADELIFDWWGYSINLIFGYLFVTNYGWPDSEIELVFILMIRALSSLPMIVISAIFYEITAIFHHLVCNFIILFWLFLFLLPGLCFRPAAPSRTSHAECISPSATSSLPLLFPPFPQAHLLVFSVKDYLRPADPQNSYWFPSRWGVIVFFVGTCYGVCGGCRLWIDRCVVLPNILGS